jgi:hypothetical protein
MHEQVAASIWSRWFAIPLIVRVAILVWGALLVGVTLRSAIAPVHSGSVFPIYRLAAERWASGEDLYTLDPTHPFFRYHPAVAVSMTPWTLPPLRIASILWRWAGAALLLGGLALWLRRLSPAPLTPAREGLLFLLVAPLALQSVNNAQINVHLLGLLLLGLVFAAERRWTLSAGLLAAATLLKLYPAVLGLLLTTAFPRRFGPRYLLMVGAGFALPFLAQRLDYVLRQYALWLEYLRGDTRFGATLDVAYRDICMVLRLYFVPLSETAYRLVEAGSALLFAALCWALHRRRVGERVLFAAVLHLGCLWMTVLGPSTESNTYTLLGPTAAMLFVFAPEWRSRAVWSLLVFGYVLLIVPPFATAFPGGKHFQEWGPQPAGAMLILIVALLEIWKDLTSQRHRTSAHSD